MLTLELIDSSSDEELFSLLGHELEEKISAKRGSAEFLSQIRVLPVGLRSMAATYELDVSFALDDLGWHFGNWHDEELSEETAKGLEELGAPDLARIFTDAFQLARLYWKELGGHAWKDWYHGSPFEQAVGPLDDQARAILNGRKRGIFKYWADAIQTGSVQRLTIRSTLCN